jgi:hypothetical protein
MQRLEVSSALRHTHIYIYIYMTLGSKGLRHNNVIVKVKVYEVGYVIVIHNDTRSTKYQK